MTAPPPIAALARLIVEDRIVTVLCRLANETMVKDTASTWWERNANLSSTGVRHKLAEVIELHSDLMLLGHGVRRGEGEVVQLHPGADRPCDTKEK
jgi:hypothetical protein